jgi:hypothetical protein
VHMEFCCDRGECSREVNKIKDRSGSCHISASIAVEIPFHAHEEQAKIVIVVLIGVEDVGPVFVQQPGNTGHESLPVGAVDQQNGCVLHLDQLTA